MSAHPKKSNHLASFTERLQAVNALPETFITYQKQQAMLTQAFCQALTGVVDEQSLAGCQVVRFFNGELIISCSSTTLVNHLRYLSSLILSTLQNHPTFAAVQKLHLAHLTA